MTTLVQLNYDDLQAALKNCLREAINEFKELPMQPEQPDRIGLPEACSLTDFSKSKLYKLSMQGGIPCEKFGKRLVFSRKELTAWMKARTVRVVPASDIMTDRLASLAKKKS